ncbi:mucin-2 [Uranotaenia lowii]|uniref:mucin-2 n=1 Tax=Uranotaenia lowii TaxID=190385 RepID=UPI0024797D52|nr:mucin-2 [Uranotaenia lowii]XP_055590509.1 mucin-2 [Uranotaenia lowii]XP_055590513.1 mucin-2 [Uranotaenia lowii]XP_055590521.1 mucin-2 [Uranotaenia lowii]
MSCQQPASRVQEDPYAFTEPAPLQANTSLYKHSGGIGSSSAAVADSTVTGPIIQAGTSLLASSNNVATTTSLNHAVQHRLSVSAAKTVNTPIKVTLVQSPSTSAVMTKSRLNGSAALNTPTAVHPVGTVFRTVSVPQPTTIVHRSVEQSSVSAATGPTLSPTVFTKPLQVQVSPQQSGKFSRRVLASKSPNVSPTIQTVRIVKSASPQQPPGGRPSITPDARRYLNHSSNSISLQGSTPTTAAPVAPALHSTSPTKIRLIQPQAQGKIFLHTPNSSNSLAAATHISNPASIAALRNTLARQNPSLLNKIPAVPAPHGQPQTTTPPQPQGNRNTVLPMAADKSSISMASINIRRTSPPIITTSQSSLEVTNSITNATTTIATSVTPGSQLVTAASTSIAVASVTTPSPQVIPQQRSKTPIGSSILKPQLQNTSTPPPPAASTSTHTTTDQEDIGFTIPSFIIPKQDPKLAVNVNPSPQLLNTSTSPFQSTIESLQSNATPSTHMPTPKSQGKKFGGTVSGGSTTPLVSHQATPKRTKRSYSRSSHHETLERIALKEDELSHPHQRPTQPIKQTTMPKFTKWKPPGAVAVPLNREWHAPDTYMFDVCETGFRAMDEETLNQSRCTQEYWFQEIYNSSPDMDSAESDPPGGSSYNSLQGKPRRGRKPMGKQQPPDLMLNNDSTCLAMNQDPPKLLTRDERLELKRAYLRRKAVQYWNGQKLRSDMDVRKHVKTVEKMLLKLERQRDVLKKNTGTQQTKCQRPGCPQVAVLSTTHCYQHITDNNEQRLFQQCTAKFSDNSQCRKPVFDVRHELILCREHAWKHDNHDKMSAEVKMLKKPFGGSAASKKKPPKVVTPKTTTVSPAAVSSATSNKKKSKKKKLTPFQQQMALHQQQYKQQYSSINHSKTTLPPPPYGVTQTVHQKQSTQHHALRHQQQQPSPSQIKYHPKVSVSPQATAINRNVHIPLNQHRQLGTGTFEHHFNTQQHTIGRRDDLLLNQQHQISPAPVMNLHHQQLTQQTQHFSQQQVHQLLNSATTQDLLNICENSSAYASSEDTGVGGLSESELMATQDVIEEIPFEIQNLNNVLSQLPPDAFNELLFSEQEQNGPTFESTQEEEEDLERALEVVGEHVKSLEDMTVESANFLGDFLDNVDDEMLDGSDICSDQMLQSPSAGNDIRGLVHT